VITVRKITTILGILMIVTILINGSAIAGTWHYGQDVVFEENCTNSSYILYAPDEDIASIGKDNPTPTLGRIHVDLGEDDWMGPDQNFTVFGGSIGNSYIEEYDVWVSEDDETVDYEDYCGRGNDTEYEEFWTPSESGKEWRYIYIEARSGDSRSDFAYGPDINAIGWYEP
jgi:hypothetical protein